MNNTIIDLHISKDFDNNIALKVISDKLIVANCYLSGGKDVNGNYRKSLPVQVNILETTNVPEPITSGDYIRVSGFVTPHTYEKNGKEITVMCIVADEIIKILPNTEGCAE